VPAGNKWIRIAGEKSNDEGPSPKKPKLGENPQTNDAEAGPSNYGNNSKGKKVSEAVQGVRNDNMKETVQENINDTEDSEDEGLNIGDLCMPGAESLSFGSFDSVEIRKLTCMAFTEGKSFAINEYGTNMYGGTFDSLAAIEAKRAIQNHDFCPTGTGFKCCELGQSSSIKELLPVIEANEKEIETERAVSLSPATGTQEPPIAVSNQEEVEGKSTNEERNTQINWDELTHEEEATGTQKIQHEDDVRP